MRKFHWTLTQNPKNKRFGKKLYGTLTLFLALIYQPVDKNYHGKLIDVLSTLSHSTPKNYIIITAHDVNTSIGIRKNIHTAVLGPNEKDN